MKLSDALEEALVSGTYGLNHYMCIALRRMGYPHLVPQVARMVHSLNPEVEYYDDIPLACVLDDIGLIAMNIMPPALVDAYTTQFYVWWVFDLKRKGL